MNNQYLMLLRGTNWDTGLTAEETAAHVAKYHAWFERMTREGKIAGGTPLLETCRMVSKQGDRISDGPFIESKESIGGYIIINATDCDAAVAIVKTFPPVELGVHVEIRQLTDVCPISQRLAESHIASSAPGGV